MSYQYIVIHGNLVEGFHFTGPYATRAEAELAAGDSTAATIARLWAPAKQMPYDAD